MTKISTPWDGVKAMLQKRTFSIRLISAAFWSLQILPKPTSPPPKVCPLRAGDTMLQEQCCLDNLRLAGPSTYIVTGSTAGLSSLCLAFNPRSQADCKKHPLPHRSSTCGFLSAVVVTIGPSCQDVEALCQLLQAGATCARCDLTVSYFYHF